MEEANKKTLNEEEMADLNKSNTGLEKNEVRIYPLRSRLSFTEVELKNLDNMTRWTPYESSVYEQPILFTCCCPSYFKFRSHCLCPLKCMLPFSKISFGKALFFLIFIAISAGAGYFVRHSLGASGILACLYLGLAFAFPTRNSVWLFITGIPFERVLFWHKYMAVLSVPMGVYHGVVSKRLDLSGIILVALMFIITISSFYKIRRQCFEFFYRFHWVIFLIIIPIAFIHGAAVAMIGAGLWLIDFLLRAYIVQKNKNRALMAELTQIEPGLIKVCFPNNNFQYKAGQYIFICVPELSVWEWHPFSLSSSPNEKAVSVHVRVLGDWTKRLYDMSAGDNVSARIWMDGPYGNCKLDIDSDEYKLFILVSGGVGVTPLQSICNQLIYEHLRGRNLKKILFIWSVRDKFLFDSIVNSPGAYYSKKLPAKLPFAFQPDVLVKHEHEHVLESAFHLTSARDEKEYSKANIDPIKQKLVKFGRPKLREYFEKMVKISKENHESKVAVLCCGPAVLMKECRNLTKEFSRDGLTFGFHDETFDF